MTYEELGNQPPAVLDKLPIAVLANLQEQAEAHLADASRMVAILYGVFSRRYADGLNDMGTHRRLDGDYEIKITVPKRVEWDQEELDHAVGIIRSWNENPTDYVDFKLSVAESKYKAWPPAIRDLFTPARTVKAGKAKFEIARASREAA